MASHKEMKRLADDAAAVRNLATALLNHPDADWTDWEIDFLENMARFEGPEPISTRQREVLFELRDSSRHYSSVDGLSVANLVRDCWIARLDLSEDDELFISDLKSKSVVTLKRRQLLRLLHCSRELQLIHHYVAI